MEAVAEAVMDMRAIPLRTRQMWNIKGQYNQFVCCFQFASNSRICNCTFDWDGTKGDASVTDRKSVV